MLILHSGVQSVCLFFGGYLVWTPLGRLIMTKHVEIVEASLFRIKVFKVFRDENPLREQKTLLNEGFFS